MSLLQFFALNLSIVIVIFVICHYWDKFDKYKQKQQRNRSQR